MRDGPFGSKSITNATFCHVIVCLVMCNVLTGTLRQGPKPLALAFVITGFLWLWWSWNLSWYVAAIVAPGKGYSKLNPSCVPVMFWCKKCAWHSIQWNLMWQFNGEGLCQKLRETRHNVLHHQNMYSPLDRCHKAYVKEPNSYYLREITFCINV